MKTIWYEPLLNELRLHIEYAHMNEDNALDELKFAEEEFAYGKYGDEENVRIGCPWSIHCNCKWEVEGYLEIRLVRII